MNTKTTTNTLAAAPAAAPLASTTSASAFEAARGRGHFGRYGFDGIAQPLPSTPAPKTATRTASWMDRFYPDSFRPKSGLAKAMLLPVGMVISLAAMGKALPDFSEDTGHPLNSIPVAETDLSSGMGTTMEPLTLNSLSLDLLSED